MNIKKVDFSVVTEFENKVAEFFGAPYAVAVDSCTHGIELCLMYTNAQKIRVPKQTYLSVPMLAHKLNIEIEWMDWQWTNYYSLTPWVYDAAVYWKKNGYLSPNKFMCVSFQFQKHLSLGRGGVILLDDKDAAIQLKKMSYDGRLPGIPWRDQDVDTMGYHYYMQIEMAELGLDKLPDAIATEPRKWSYLDYPDLTQMKIFKDTL
jgi:dTDP-4-amino-4,6-dideoxygalactose transaminase